MFFCGCEWLSQSGCLILTWNLDLIGPFLLLGHVLRRRWLECGPLRQIGHLQVARWSVALLLDPEPLHVWVGLADLRPRFLVPDEHHDVGVLLDLSRFAKVRQFRLDVFRSAQLRCRDQRSAGYLSESLRRLLQVARD